MKTFVKGAFFMAILLASSQGWTEARVSSIRVAFEPKDDSFFIREMVTLMPGEEEKNAHVSLEIPFPRDAVGVILSKEHDASGITLQDDGIRVEGHLPKEGRAVAFMYTLPQRDNSVTFEQVFDRPVQLAHIAFVGPSKGIRMEGPDFSMPAVRDIAPGLPALFVVGKDFDDGRVRISIFGFKKSLMSIFMVVVTSLSFGILLLGFILYLRRRD